MEVPVSSLSSLSLSQVERASFTPGGFTQPSTKEKKLPSESASTNALQALQRRLAEQDARISLLEKKLRKNRLEPAEETDEGRKENVSAARSVPVSSLPAQPKDVRIGLIESNDGVISSKMRYQILQLKLYSIVQQRRSITAEPSPPLASPPEHSPAQSLFDDFSPVSENPAPANHDYSPDDLRAFESHLEMKAASSLNNYSDAVQKETIKTLLEGIGSPTDVPQDYKTEPKHFLPVSITSTPI